jgi:hypothetical protein
MPDRPSSFPCSSVTLEVSLDPHIYPRAALLFGFLTCQPRCTGLFHWAPDAVFLCDQQHDVKSRLRPALGFTSKLDFLRPTPLALVAVLQRTALIDGSNSTTSRSETVLRTRHQFFCPRFLRPLIPRDRSLRDRTPGTLSRNTPHYTCSLQSKYTGRDTRPGAPTGRDQSS